MLEKIIKNFIFISVFISSLYSLDDLIVDFKKNQKLACLNENAFLKKVNNKHFLNKLKSVSKKKNLPILYEVISKNGFNINKLLFYCDSGCIKYNYKKVIIAISRQLYRHYYKKDIYNRFDINRIFIRVEDILIRCFAKISGDIFLETSLTAYEIDENIKNKKINNEKEALKKEIYCWLYEFEGSDYFRYDVEI